MLRLLLSQLRFRPTRPVALGVAVVVASASFVLLSSAAKTSDLRVKGSVESNFRTAYDILVRPRGSFTQLERRAGLVRDNYLSGIFGGITLEQYAAIRRIPGVQIAAPIANIGYVLTPANTRIPLTEALTRDPVQLFRLNISFLAHNRRSTYPEGKSYVYYTRRNRLFDGPGGINEALPDGRALNVCYGLYRGPAGRSGPFDQDLSIFCFSSRSPGQGSDSGRIESLGMGEVGAVASFYYPIFVSAIDPEQEARLLDLDAAIVSGRYFRKHEAASIDRTRQRRHVPVIASTRTYVDEHLSAEIEGLHFGQARTLPDRLADRRAYWFLKSLRGDLVRRWVSSPGPTYTRLIRDELFSTNYWTPGRVTYDVIGDRRLRARTTTNPISIWRAPAFVYHNEFFPAPKSNADVQFRRLGVHVGSNKFGPGNVLNTPFMRVVGRFDPGRLPGFSPLARVPLETYYPPVLEPADDLSRAALGGKQLLPTQNLGDYIQQPPLLLTTLEGMKPFLNPVFFSATKGKARAPISVIRIRVAGVKGADSLSQGRIRTVALEVRDRTGLDVDITAGSSPRPLQVELPAGKFGRPALLLREGWVKKGVSVSFLRALDNKRLALFSLILLSCGLFLVNSTWASVRERRREIGTLLCVGWPRAAIVRALIVELAIVGLMAGLLGAGLAALTVVVFSLEVTVMRTLLVVPMAFILTQLAAIVPAWRAARSVPLDAVRPAIPAEMNGRSVRSLASVAFVNLLRQPGRALAGVFGLLLGVACLTLLLAINRAFEGKLVGTLLGDAILFRTRGIDYLAVGLVVVLAGLSLADVLFLNLSERAPEFVTLRTAGWGERHLASLVSLEALGLGLLGGLGGAFVGVGLGALVGVSAEPLLFAAAFAAAGGTGVALLASIVPLTRLRSLTPAVVLAEE